MMANKLGLHIHGMKPGIIQAVELLQPRTITMMDPTAQEIRDIYSAADPVTVVRKYEDGRSFTQTDPRWWAEEYYRMVGDAVSGRLIAMGWNEPFGHDSRALCPPFDEWNRAFIERCRELGPMDGGALGMATGNWTGAADRYRITADFPLTCEIAKWFLPHEYSWPDLQAGAGWYALRFKAWIEDLKAIGRDDFHFIIAEAGLTQGIIAGRDDVGWRSESPENVTEDSYIATLDWYNAELCKVPECLGCCLYDWAGQWYGWPTFEQLGLENRIYQIQAPELPEPPEPPEEDPMDIKVFDMLGNELLGPAAEEMVALHGLSWEMPPGLSAGDCYFKLTALREKPSSSLIYKLLDLYGNPVANPDETLDLSLPHRAFWWNGIDDDANDIVVPYSTDHHPKADLGGFNVNGEGASGMGIGAYHDPYTPGPHECWVRHPTIPTMLVKGQGMLGATAHLHLDMEFEEAVYVNGEPPPNDEKLDMILAGVGENQALLLEIKDLLITSPPPPPPPPPEPEFAVRFYNSVDLSGPVAAEMKEKPSFWNNWGQESPAPGVTADYWSAEWVGVFPFEDRTYTFNFRVDDGVRLFVDDVLVFESWKPQSATGYSKDLVMKAGRHKVRVEFVEWAGDATLHFNWV